MKIEKLVPAYKNYTWGGDRLKAKYNKHTDTTPLAESWELSFYPDSPSYAESTGLPISEAATQADIGTNATQFPYFPMLIKFIDAKDNLSVQVHPSDEYAMRYENLYGKTEMWYVIDCEKGAKLYVGFNRETDREEYLRHLENGTLADLLGAFEVKPGDAYFIPAGTIHAIGKGNLIAEIQQTSDITYRVFDWNRKDAQGRSRELHTELALDAIDFTSRHDYDITVIPQPDQAVQMQSCPYFTSAVLEVETALERDLAAIDSFVIYICLEGNVELVWEEGTETLKKGETVLVPAVIDSLEWKGKGKLIEVYVP